MHIDLFKYRAHSTGDSSAHYGLCEVCHRYVSDVWLQVRFHFFAFQHAHEYHQGCAYDTSLFGHESCLRAHQRHPTQIPTKRSQDNPIPNPLSYVQFVSGTPIFNHLQSPSAARPAITGSLFLLSPRPMWFLRAQLACSSRMAYPSLPPNSTATEKGIRGV